MLGKSELDSFLSEGLTQMAWSKHTVAAYSSDLRSYLAHLEAQGLKTLAASDADSIIEFLSDRRLEGDQPRTVNRRLASIRSFYHFLMREKLIDGDPLVHLPSPKRAALLPHYLTRDEVHALLEAPDGQSPLALRNRCLIEVLYATGIRISELLGIEPLDILRRDDGLIESLKVFGKGRKERFVPLYQRAAKSLDDYLLRGRPKLIKPLSDSALFLNLRGRALSRQGAYACLRQLGEKAGIRQRVTPHLLRHTFATHLVHEGADLRSVQELLGHANLETTTIYTSVDADRIRAVHRRHHPRG